jgi:hypothetical protein
VKKSYIFLFLILIAALASSHNVESLPYGTPREWHIYMPAHWHVHECEECPSGYMCRYEEWVPSVYVFGRPLWVFGISNEQQIGGILNFRPYPGYDCPEACTEDIPILYTAELVYVQPWNPDFNIEDVPLTYIPPGKYVVTSPSFLVGDNSLWYFPDDGTGAHHMSADLKTNKPKYSGGESSARLTLKIMDKKTGEYIQADSIKGDITLPDSTKKIIKPEDWSWDPIMECHYYMWDFTNDQGSQADPKEGIYTAHVYVKKRFYEDVQASTTFGVCYHATLALEFDKDIPEYDLGECVHVTVTAADEESQPLDGHITSVLSLPDGSEITDLEWTSSAPGIYSMSYPPKQEGSYSITTGISTETTCYLEEARGTFYVRDCEKAFATLEIGESFLDEPVDFLLTVVSEQGEPLSGGEVKSLLYLPDDTHIPLSWVDNEDGTYSAEYTPSSSGLYSVCGVIIVEGEGTCYKALFDGSFAVTHKALPDLVILNEDISLNPASPHIKEEVIISVTVRNEGKADAENFWVILLIDDEVVHRVFIEILAKDESVTITYTWIPLHSGGYIIQAIADPPEGLL